MAEQLMLSIGIGLGVSLLFSELFGLAGGGMIVPGYFALFLNRPLEVALTLFAALVTYWIVSILSNVIILYGRRRTVLMVLVGYLVGVGLRLLIQESVNLHGNETLDLIGYIIPGLIAIWIERQGMVETFTTLVTASVVVRLALILVLGEVIIQ